MSLDKPVGINTLTATKAWVLYAVVSYDRGLQKTSSLSPLRLESSWQFPVSCAYPRTDHPARQLDSSKHLQLDQPR
jgi:hypothetical protein